MSRKYDFHVESRLLTDPPRPWRPVKTLESWDEANTIAQALRRTERTKKALHGWKHTPTTFRIRKEEIRDGDAT